MNDKTAIKRIFSGICILLLALFIAACGASPKQLLKTEKDYQRAFNDVYFQGRAAMEVSVKYGRADLVSSDYAIEVDRLDNFHEAIGQALHYAKETEKKPAAAFFVPAREAVNREKLQYVTWLCNYYKIKVWFINDELEKAGKRR